MKENRIAVVTEAGNGLGKTLTTILIENDYKVVLAATKDSLNQLSMEREYNSDCILLETDFTSRTSLENLFNKVENSYGKLDLLINNAEIANGFGHKLEQLKIEE